MFLRQGGRFRPLGRYLAEQVAMELGIEDAWQKRKDLYKQECAEELYELYADTEIGEASDIAKAYSDRRAGAVQRIEGKTKALGMRRTL